MNLNLREVALSLVIAVTAVMIVGVVIGSQTNEGALTDISVSECFIIDPMPDNAGFIDIPVGNLEPNQSKERTISAENTCDLPQKISFDFDNPPEPLKLDLSPSSQQTVDPGEIKIFKVTVEAPGNTLPGKYNDIGFTVNIHD